FGGGGGRRRSWEQRGADVREDLKLDFEEAVFGATKEVKVRRHEACASCHGSVTVITNPCPTCKGDGRQLRERTIEVKVPAGVEDGTRIRYAGQGEAGVHGGPPGDLYVVLHVSEHPFFERDGKNLLCVLPISFPQAALGA